MNAVELARVKEELVVAAELAGRSLSDITLKAMAGHLAELPAVKTIEAIRDAQRKGKFPTIDEIAKHVNPQLSPLDEAREVASLIIASISKFGYARALDAEKYMGDFAWKVVERGGGWAWLCENVTTRNSSQYIAQLRDIAESLGKRAALGILDTRPTLKNLEHKGGDGSLEHISPLKLVQKGEQ
jgi:hypothetical protein